MTGYVVERSDVTRGGWVTVGSTDSHTFNFKIPKLLEGNKYYFRVMAENAVGTGKPLETFQAVEVKSPYGVLPVSLNMSILISFINCVICFIIMMMIILIIIII